MSKVEYHLFEKAAQALGVNALDTRIQIEAVFDLIAEPTPVQRMAADVLLSTPLVTRAAILQRVNAQRREQKMIELINKINLFDLEQHRGRFQQTNKNEFMALLRAKFQAALDEQSEFDFYVNSIFQYPLKSITKSRRVIITAKDFLFIDMLKFLGLADEDGFEDDEKVIQLEIEPDLSSPMQYEVRYVTSGKRGGEKTKPVTELITSESSKWKWRRQNKMFTFPESWSDFVLSSILNEYTDYAISSNQIFSVGDPRRCADDFLIAHLRQLQEKWKTHYPLTIREITRILHLRMDTQSVRKMKAAERSRQWRADHPKQPIGEEERLKRNAYMRDYRKKNRAELQENQRAYTQKWRKKKRESTGNVL